MELKQRFERALAHSGMTIPDLIKAMKVSKAAAYFWLDGTTKELKGPNLLKAARALGVRAEWLGEGKGPMTDDPQTALTDIPVSDIQFSENIQAEIRERDIPPYIREAVMTLVQSAPKRKSHDDPSSTGFA